VKGDMLFIGPRPIMPTELKLMEMRSKNGIDCKPGITGLAQVCGRDVITVTKKVACERYYNRNKGKLSLRIYILWKTIVIVINKTGISH
jgi:lipopolysaccharide/colanic/teichoic acid biosynthesis glycosyltransferase